MRELLVTITLLSVVSSEESEHKKRLEIPPEVDPNFWPVRGRRSYWDVGQPTSFSTNLIDQENERPDGFPGRQTNYAGYTSSSETSRFRPAGPEEKVFDRRGELRAYFDAGRRRLCPQKRSISLVLPLPSYRPDDIGADYFCGGRCGGGGIGERRKADEDGSQRQQPLYVDEPGWIAIDYRRGNFQENGKNGDPFFITRGKKNEELGDGGGNGESKRRLEEALEAYAVGPFFVARGKKGTYDEEVGGDYEGSRSELPNSSSFKSFQEFKIDSKMNSRYPVGWHRRTRRGTSPRNRGGEEEEDEEKVKGKEKRKEQGEKEEEEEEEEEINVGGVEKFSSDRYPGKTGRTLTKRDKNSARNFRSYDEFNDEVREYPKNIIKKNEDSNDADKYDKSNFDDGAVMELKSPRSSPVFRRLSTRGFFADYEPRNSQTHRDKHSNLQSILDEPFFISRGKKTEGSKVAGYLREVRKQDDLQIKKPPPSSPIPAPSPEKKPVIISDIFNIYRGRKTSSLYYGDDDNNGGEGDKDNNDSENDYENNYEKSKHRQRNIGSDSLYGMSRNRRGMLDDILSSDDPFYVARGKRPQPRRPIITINRVDTDPEDRHANTAANAAAAAAANELSIYTKSLTRRTKLLRKLSDFNRQNNF